MGVGPSTPDEAHREWLLSRLDTACAEAARLISKADVLLLCTGAGFSADSGLAVYADVAKVAAYAQRDLSYHDICQPRWQRSDPELFWGFWGQCYNDYRDTAPHSGYKIIERWVEKRFRHSTTAEAIRQRLVEKAGGACGGDGSSIEVLMGEEASSVGRLEPYEVTDHPGAFFVFTSNVDAHHFDWFRACEIRECHGNTELYQCSEVDGHQQPVWRVPLDFRFQVDTQTMLAPATAAPAPGPSSTAREAPAAETTEATQDTMGTDAAVSVQTDTAAGTEAPAAATHTPLSTAEVPEVATDSRAATAEAPVASMEAPVTTTEVPEVAVECPAATDCPASEIVATSLPAATEAAAAETAAGGAPVREDAAAGRDAADQADARGEGAAEPAKEQQARAEDAVPRVGQVLRSERTTMLRHMPPAPRWTSFEGFKSNHPKCPFCGGDARPAILMFGDMEWQDVPAQSQRWNNWRKAVRAFAEEAEEEGRPQLRAVILEIGAGGNVTTVRNTSEQQLRALLQHGADASLVRVNPEFPLVDDEDLNPEGGGAAQVISVMNRGLDSLHRIERAMVALEVAVAAATPLSTEPEAGDDAAAADGTVKS